MTSTKSDDQLPLHLEGKAIVSVKTGLAETVTNVFKPTAKTKKDAKAAVERNVVLTITDASGDFTPQVPQRVVLVDYMEQIDVLQVVSVYQAYFHITHK